MTTPIISAAAEAAARRFVSTKLDGFNTTSTPFSGIQACIESTYPGGFTAWLSSFRSSLTNPAPAEAAPISSAGAGSNQRSPMQTRALATSLLAYASRRLGRHDIIEHLAMNPERTHVTLRVRFNSYREFTRRDRITSSELALFEFTRTALGQPWSVESASIEVPITDATEVVHFGTINTPERDEDKADQAGTCYRPGTESTPMRGWVAQLGISHAQAHAGERFQKVGN